MSKQRTPPASAFHVTWPDEPRATLFVARGERQFRQHLASLGKGPCRVTHLDASANLGGLRVVGVVVVLP